MATIFQYEFKSKHVTSPDGTVPCDLPADTDIVDGPGAFAFAGGRVLPKAARVGYSGAIAVDVGSHALPDISKFHVQVIFCIDGGFNEKAPPQYLIESERLPLALYLQGQTDYGVKVAAAVKSSTVGYRAVDFSPLFSIVPKAWHVVDLVYLNDTLSVVLNGKHIGCHGFGANGTITPNTADRFIYVGGREIYTRFGGRIAAASVSLAVPAALEQLCDAHRTTPQWYISSAVENRRPINDPGQPAGPPRFAPPASSWLQNYKNGALMYNPAGTAAFHIYGMIWERYKGLPGSVQGTLGYLASDELPSRGKDGRKSMFQGGGIYWSPSTPATEVLGPIYASYEAMGEASKFGFPLAAAETIDGGRMQRMQGATFFYKDGTAVACEVNGAIREAFQASGGVGRWGYPVSNEIDVPGLMTKPPPAPPGGGFVISTPRNVKASHFEKASFFWSADTGANVVYGDIYARWTSVGGPQGRLGLPVTSEMDIPNRGRMSGFEHGVICWFGNYSNMAVVSPFRLFIGVVDTVESEGFGQGQNDVYFRVKIQKDGRDIFAARYPGPDGDYEGMNIVSFNQKVGPQITPEAGAKYTFNVEVWDADSGGGGEDDYLGTWVSPVLDATNGFGFDMNHGILNSGRIDKINNISAAVQMDVDINSLTDAEKYWGVGNVRTDPVDYESYAEAFGVDSSPEDWDVLDWIDKGFYEVDIKHLAGRGRCFGMSLEAINAHIGSSLFSFPLNRFTWDEIGHVMTVQHIKQHGADSVWFFVRQFLSGNTHDPKDVFYATQAHHARRDWPVLSISQNYDFGGEPHAIVPVAWNASSKPAEITVYDSNFPGVLKKLQVDMDKNTFHYDGDSVYDGGSWSGGRMYFTPWSCVRGVVSTPVVELVVMLVAGVVVAIGSGVETVSLTGRSGESLDAHGPAATGKLQKGQPLDGYFVKPPSLAGANVHGGLLCARGHQGAFLPAPPPLPQAVTAKLNAAAPQEQVERDMRLPYAPWFRHVVRARALPTTHDHLIKAGGAQVRLTAGMDGGETAAVEVRDLNTSGAAVAWEHARGKAFSAALTHRRGLSRDAAVTMRLDLVSAAAGRVTLAPRPGLAGLDVDPGPTAGVTSARLTLTVARDGLASRYAVDLLQAVGHAGGPLADTLRIRLPPGRTDGRIAVSKVNQQGQITRSSVVVAGQAVFVNRPVPEKDVVVIK